MKHIRKGAQPPELAAWKRSIRPKGSIPAWNLPNPPRNTIRDLLTFEQLQLCCYCCGTIANGNFHIEHFCPRDGYEELTYTWKNLLASCQGGGDHMIDTRRHCGSAKDNWYVNDVTVDPRSAQVTRLFRFPFTGKIFPSKYLDPDTYAAVLLTIEKLNLCAPSLVSRRAALLEQANSHSLAMDRPMWLARYLNVHNRKLQEFWPALNYNYKLHWSGNFR